MVTKEATAATVKGDIGRITTKLAFAAIVIIQNAMLAAGSPPANDAPINEITQYYVDNSESLTIAVGLVAINMPLLLVFATGIYGHIRSAGHWARLGVGGVFVMAPIFAITTALQASLVFTAGERADQEGLIQLLWTLHSAVFVMNGVALGITLGSLARAAHLARLTPAWAAYLV